MSSTDTSRRQVGFLFRYALQSFAIVIILAVLIRTFFLSSYVMSGYSMLPTIWPGDFLVAARWNLGQLRRGDVVVLRCPSSKEAVCMKRVVGLPGDRVEFRESGLVVNGQAAVYQSLSPEVQAELVAGRSWLIWPPPSRPVLAPVVVPPQHVFLLNDKRSDVEDSRSWGPVPLDQIEGRALNVWLSLDWNDGPLLRSWPRIRWTRLLRSID